MKRNDGGPAFPVALPATVRPQGGQIETRNVLINGMSLRDYFAIHGPAPEQKDILHIMERERLANPHGDVYKPKRRSAREIECALRYEWADAMILEREE